MLVEEGSLYPALYRMERRGWLEAEWGESELGRRAKLYRLTRQGRAQLAAETDSLAAVHRRRVQDPAGPMRRSLRSWLWRVPIEQEVDEELALHVEMRRATGAGRSSARRRSAAGAAAATASPSRRKRDREMRLTQWLGDFGDDVRFAVRQMRASPGFTLVATLTLALGIGANSAIFALADATLLRPLPFREPDRLVLLVGAHPTAPRAGVARSRSRRAGIRSRSFESSWPAIRVGAGGGPLVDGAGRHVEAVERQYVSTRFFDVLGVVPVAGRTFRAADEAPAPDRRHLQRKALAGALRRRSRRSSAATVKLNGRPHTLVGVVPDDAQFTRPARMWTLNPEFPPFVRQRSFGIIEVVGRLKPGVTLEGARADVAAIGAAHRARSFPAPNKDSRSCSSRCATCSWARSCSSPRCSCSASSASCC